MTEVLRGHGKVKSPVHRADTARMGPDRLSWLCRDEAQRERVLDMERRLRPVRAATLGVLCLALLAAAPTEGWWTLAPLLLAGLGFLAADLAMRRSSRPEWAIASAWALSQTAIAVSVALSGGPDSPAVAWLAIPAVTLSARFDGRGVVAGLAFTVGLLLAVTLGVDAAAVLAHPAVLLSPLALVAAVTLLSTALMASDLEHRSESVLDGLTGMLNRRSLSARAAELEEQAALSGQAIGLVLCDLDRFKRVNDEHGHQAGDAVLVDVAYTLRKELRAFDLAYRLGGEEFLVVLPGATLPDALHVAERLRAAVETTPAGGLSITMSCGVASATGAGFQFAQVSAAADAALYDAKRAGRNRVAAAGAGARALVAA
jgi:diguanylate cyclase (GGDEF)-like protein